MNTKDLEPVNGWNQAAQINENELQNSRQSGGTLFPRAERMKLQSFEMWERNREIESWDSVESLANDLRSRYY
ncbi:MAG: hypothetical protein V4727_11685 [Verrucomicrobiota bacterium]